MNDAFKREISDMISEERTAAELEECYFSDDDLVPNKSRRRDEEEEVDEDDDYEMEEEEVEENLDDIIKAAEGEDEEDPGESCLLILFLSVQIFKFFNFLASFFT